MSPYLIHVVKYVDQTADPNGELFFSSIGDSSINTIFFLTVSRHIVTILKIIPRILYLWPANRDWLSKLFAFVCVDPVYLDILHYSTLKHLGMDQQLVFKFSSTNDAKILCNLYTEFLSSQNEINICFVEVLLNTNRNENLKYALLESKSVTAPA